MNNFQLMRKGLSDHLAKFCSEKGLKKENKDLEQNKRLKELANDLTKFLYKEENNFEWGVNTGPNLGKTIVLTCDKKYPNEPSRTLNYEQSIKYTFKIKSNNNSYKNFKYIISTVNSETAEIKCLDEGNIYIENSIYISPEKAINYNDLIKNARNLISIKVECIEDKTIYDNASFPVYIDIPDEKEVDDFDIDIEYDKDINKNEFHLGDNIKYNKFVIFNNSNYSGTIGLNISVQDTTQRNQEIEKIFQKNDIYIEKHSVKEIEIPNIIFNDKYNGRKGKLRIRYALVNINGIDIVEQYDKLFERFDSLYFEEPKPEKSNGLPFDVATAPFDDDKIYMRSRLEKESINKYKLIFNSRYVLWKDVNKTDQNNTQKILYDLYSTEEMVRAMIQIQLIQLNYKIIDCENGMDYTPDIIQKKIDIKVNEYLGKYFEGR